MGKGQDIFLPKEDVEARGPVWDQLEEYIDKGYVLHGSPAKITKFYPKPTADVAKKFGNDTAVFATRAVPSALFSAIVDRQVLPEGTDRRVKMFYKREINDKTGEELVITDYGVSKALHKAGALKRKGWVYVLPSETFIHDTKSNESKSHVPIKPLLALPVTRRNFPFKIRILENNGPSGSKGIKRIW